MLTFRVYSGALKDMDGAASAVPLTPVLQRGDAYVMTARHCTEHPDYNSVPLTCTPETFAEWRHVDKVWRLHTSALSVISQILPCTHSQLTQRRVMLPVAAHCSWIVLTWTSLSHSSRHCQRSSRQQRTALCISPAPRSAAAARQHDCRPGAAVQCQLQGEDTPADLEVFHSLCGHPAAGHAHHHFGNFR
jgi:hypothetical protein